MTFYVCEHSINNREDDECRHLVIFIDKISLEIEMTHKQIVKLLKNHNKPIPIHFMEEDGTDCVIS